MKHVLSAERECGTGDARIRIVSITGTRKMMKKASAWISSGMDTCHRCGWEALEWLKQ